MCYEVLPFIFDYQLNRDNSAVLVVSPLISLMMDQVHSLRKRSVDAAIISSGVKVSNIYNAHLVLQYVHGNITLCWYKKLMRHFSIFTCKVNRELLATDKDFRNSRLLFMAPEAIDVQKWRDAITAKSFSSRVVTVVIDEAHCVSKWYAMLTLS